jgi:hypothetical protein
MSPTPPRYDRLDLELYADRLTRHASRLADEVAAARLRLCWQRLEREAQNELGATAWMQLETLGIVSGCINADDQQLLTRRRDQLAALAQLQELVEQRIQLASEATR